MKLKLQMAAVFLLALVMWPQLVHAQYIGIGQPAGGAAYVNPAPPAPDPIAESLSAMLGFFIDGGIALINAGSNAFAYIISANLDNTAVKTLWVLVLGLVNLGFLLALVTIALLTTLRIEIGGGVQRLLPRLFIGALLVNFSLVICLLILDVVNIGIASLSLTYDRAQPDRISSDTAAQTQTLMGGKGAAFQKTTQAVLGSDPSGWSEVVGKLITTLTVWLVAVALWITVAFVGLRYLMLVLLIGVSPVAYLAVAWPNMGSIAAKWWGKFLAWAFLPLGVLVILGVTLQFSDTVNKSPDLAASGAATAVEAARLAAESDVVKAMLSAVIIVAGFIMSVSVGMYSATAGSAMVTKLAGRGARVAGRGLYGGTAAKGVAYMGGALGAARERLPQYLPRGLRGVAGAVLSTKEQAKTAGRAAVERRTAPPAAVLAPKSRQEAQRARNAINTANTNPTQLSAADMSNRYVGASVARANPGALADLAQNAGSGTSNPTDPNAPQREMAAIEATIRNKAVRSELNDQQKYQIYINLDENRASRSGNMEDAMVDRLQAELQRSIQTDTAGAGGTP